MQILMKNLSDNKSASPNFVRSNQESSSTNSLVINTNNATKGKSDKSSKIEQIGANQTSNIEHEDFLFFFFLEKKYQSILLKCEKITVLHQHKLGRKCLVEQIPSIRIRGKIF